MTQLALFDFDNSEDRATDKRPVPLKVADEFGFPFQYYEPSDDCPFYLYSVQDWLVGLGITKATAQNVWTKFNSHFQNDSWKLPYQAANGKTYQLDFVQERHLYALAQQMRVKKNAPQLQKILDYLVTTGVILSEAGSDPEKAAELTEALARHHQTRLEGIVTRNELTAWLRDAFGSGFAFGKFTNEEYRGLFGRTAAQIRIETGVKNARDAMTTEGLAFVTIAESSCLRLLKGREQVKGSEAFMIVREIATSLGANVEALEIRLGIDLATGRSLLEAGTK